MFWLIHVTKFLVRAGDKVSQVPQRETEREKTDEGIKPGRVDKMDGKGRGDEKSPLGQNTFMMSSLPQEALMSAHQFQEILYVFDVVLV